MYSFTHHVENTILVSRKYLGRGDRVLIIDDFLANGAALDGLITLCLDAGAEVVGAGICIEKAFQPGGDRIRARGVRVESLAPHQEHGRRGPHRVLLSFCPIPPRRTYLYQTAPGNTTEHLTDICRGIWPRRLYPAPVNGRTIVPKAVYGVCAAFFGLKLKGSFKIIRFLEEQK